MINHTATSVETVPQLDWDSLVDGEWIEADDRVGVIHPYDGAVVRSVPMVDAEQVTAAIGAAERAVEESTLSAYERYELLMKTAAQLEDDAEEVAAVMTSEQGKPLAESRGEVDRAVQVLRLSAEEAKRLFGEYVPMDTQKGFDRSHSFTQREPLGVVAAITPFNFPLNLMGPQGRSRARGGQRGGRQARDQHPAEFDRAVRAPRCGRQRGRCATRAGQPRDRERFDRRGRDPHSRGGRGDLLHRVGRRR